MKQRFLIILGGGVLTLMVMLVGLAVYKSSDHYASIRWNGIALAEPFSSSGNIGGYIWSSNIGWTKLFGNPDNYGLNMTFTESALLGGDGQMVITGGSLTSRYAWNDNVGWIDFNPSGPYPSLPSHGVRYTAGPSIGSTNNLTGWARVVNQNGSDGWDGWIKFGGASYSVNRVGCEFQGHAWGGPTVGWIKTNGANYRMGLSPNTGCEIAPIGSISSNPGPIITRSPATISWTTTAAPSELLGYRTTNPWLIDEDDDGNQVFLPSGTLLTNTSPNLNITPPNLFGGSATYGLETINRFGDAGPAFSTDITIRYELEVTCEIQPLTTDTASPVQIVATGINGVNTAQDGPTTEYDFTLSTTNGDSITASQPLNVTTTEDTTTWSDVLLDNNAEIGEVVYQIEVRDDAYETDPTRTDTIQCSSVTNFGDRQFEEVSS